MTAIRNPHSFPTWTRTLNERDACELLDVAEPGMSLADWRARSHDRLPQASRARRQELVREVERDLLDHDDTAVAASAFLRLFHAEGPSVRAGLFIGRVLYDRAGVRETLDALIHPALARVEEPLALADDARIDAATWDTFLRDHLPAGTGAAAHEKTRQTLQRHLALAGALDLSAVPHTHARRGRPAPLAFAWLVAHELRVTGRTEAPVAWAARESFAARLFACEDAYAHACIDAGVAAEILVRGYLAGQPRLHPGGDR